MNRTMHCFLDEYRHADLIKRLHLYLQYPELRFEFAQIEQSEAALWQTGGNTRETWIQMVRKVRIWLLFRLMYGREKVAAVSCCRSYGRQKDW